MQLPVLFQPHSNTAILDILSKYFVCQQQPIDMIILQCQKISQDLTTLSEVMCKGGLLNKTVLTVVICISLRCYARPLFLSDKLQYAEAIPQSWYPEYHVHVNTSPESFTLLLLMCSQRLPIRGLETTGATANTIMSQVSFTPSETPLKGIVMLSAAWCLLLKVATVFTV